MDQLSSNPNAGKWLHTVRTASTQWLVRSGDWVEGHPLSSLAFLLAVYILSTLQASLAALLWHDELYTFYIAQASSLKDLIAQSRTNDLNPPLSYLLTRLSFHLFGVGTL